jgi:glycosyltransferase involved in cell wall biosynthesis
VAVKRYGELIAALVALKERHPASRRCSSARDPSARRSPGRSPRPAPADWLRLAGRLSQQELIALYRRAWVLTSASLREGWGMTITEAAACGTPAVVTDISGHADAVVAGTSGLLVDGPAGLVDGLDTVLGDPRPAAAALRRRGRARTDADLGGHRPCDAAGPGRRGGPQAPATMTARLRRRRR